MAAVLLSTPTARPPVRPRTVRSPMWLRAYRQRSVTTDVVVLLVAVLAGHVFSMDGSVAAPGVGWLAAAALLGAWLISLAVEGVWAGHVLGTGGPEYRRILVACILPFAAVGIIGLLTNADLARSYLLVALPLGVGGLMLAHLAWRRRLTVR